MQTIDKKKSKETNDFYLIQVYFINNANLFTLLKTNKYINKSLS